MLLLLGIFNNKVDAKVLIINKWHNFYNIIGVFWDISLWKYRNISLCYSLQLGFIPSGFIIWLATILYKNMPSPNPANIIPLAIPLLSGKYSQLTIIGDI